MKQVNKETETKKSGIKSKILIVVALIIVVATVMAIKSGPDSEAEITDLKVNSAPPPLENPPAEAVETVLSLGPGETNRPSPDPAPNAEKAPKEDEKITHTAIPKLVDLGAKRCIPCKMMAPILDSLRIEYRGRFDVVFIDVWEDNSKVKEYGIRVIPTQIFYDAEGRELLRHEGFFSREDILRTWDDLGIEFRP